MLKDHPVIDQLEVWGYPKTTSLSGFVMDDSLNNEIYTGDEYLEYDGEKYLIEPLSSDAIEILEKHGAERKIA